MTPEFAELVLETRAEQWRRGRSSVYLLDNAGPTGGQQAWVRMLDGIPPGGWAALEVSRQRGKTFTVLAWVFQRLGLKPLSAVFLAQTGANAAAIVEQFTRDVTPELPPEWGVRFVDGAVAFANGSELAVFGTDNAQYRRSRGRKAHIVVLSEAAFYADLPDVEQVYQPQLQTTGGVGVYESSPALNPAHEFSSRCDALQVAGRYVRDTFWSNPRIDHEGVIRGEMERLGLTREQLLASTAFRREYLAERVTEETRAAVPAWTEDAMRELVGEWTRPQHFDAYVSLDPGRYGDPHATLFAFHDPATNTITFEDELELRSATTHIGEWAAQIKAKESQLWGVNRWEGTLSGATAERLKALNLDEKFMRVHSATAPAQPFLRVGDDDARVTVDMGMQHGVAVLPSAKHDKALWVDSLNQLIRERRVRVSSRCVRLREQLRSTLWNRSRSEWERTERDHGDLVDCFEAGTLITTARGDVPIESVTTDDEVWTRAGWQPVAQAIKGRIAPLWEVETESGRVLRGTAEHPFLTARGWVELHRLTESDTCYEWTSQSVLSGAGSGGSETPTASDATTASTMCTRDGTGRTTFIGRCGRLVMDPFRVGMSSTISTVTPSTTRSGTSRPSLNQSISGATWTQSVGDWLRKLRERLLLGLRCGPGLPHGEPRPLAGSFTTNTPKISTGVSRFGRTNASYAAASSTPKRPDESCDAAPPVQPQRDERADWTTRLGFANSVAPPSSSTNTPPGAFAAVRVRRVTATGRAVPVYNLTVAGLPEYVANGLLVHNCAIYAVRAVAWHRDCRPAPVVDRGLQAARESIRGRQQGLNALVSLRRW